MTGEFPASSFWPAHLADHNKLRARNDQGSGLSPWPDRVDVSV
jgi:hypothetical protein